jgi:hypothetical protein
MLQRLTALVILIIATSCQNKQNDEYTRFYDDGRAKPQVAIAPVIDSSSSDLSWSLSEEFSTIIDERVNRFGTLFSIPHEELENVLTHNQNPFSGDLSWVKTSFTNNEFVVFLELINHENIEIENKATAKINSINPSNLNVAMRIRILDLRGTSPKVVLQERISDSFYLPSSPFKVDYNKTSWGTVEFRNTHLYNAHLQFAKEISKRINDYILLAKSR